MPGRLPGLNGLPSLHLLSSCHADGYAGHWDRSAVALYAHVLKEAPFCRVKKVSAVAWVWGRPVVRVPNVGWGWSERLSEASSGVAVFLSVGICICSWFHLHNYLILILTRIL